MNAVKKPSVLVCVTGQYDCDRLIEAGFEQAAAEDLDTIWIRKGATGRSPLLLLSHFFFL